ncbi:hypothetical protein L9W77_16710 [Vibrio aestuarianus]|nr:hypothetical protein [Vibrio aestuarianus]
MNEKLNVRSMLVDKSTGKYVKVIDEVGLDDYIHCLTRAGTPTLTLPDFRKIIDYQHEHLDNLLKRHADEELQVKRGQVYNVWMRLKSLTNDYLKAPVVCDVISKSEEVSGWLHIRMNKLVDEYYHGTTFENLTYQEQDRALDAIITEVEAFIEIILCNIHSTSSIDIASLKHDSVIMGHCKAVNELLSKMVKGELSGQSRTVGHESYIYHFIMEDVGINSDALLSLIGMDSTSESLKKDLINSTEVHDDYEQWGNREYKTRVCSYSYVVADDHCISRIKKTISGTSESQLSTKVIGYFENK